MLPRYSLRPTSIVALAAAGALTGLLAGCTPASSIDRPFTANSVWNKPLPANAAKDPLSAGIQKSVLTNPSLVVNMILYAYGQPIYTATPKTPRVRISGMAAGDSIVPLDSSWTPNVGGDHKINVFDPASHTVFELDGYNRGAHSVIWGVSHNYVTELGDGYQPPDQYHKSPTGAGFSQVAGVIRTSDIEHGSIDHALAFITSNPTAKLFRYPASKTDGTYTGPNGIEEGMRIRLDPTLDVDKIPGITSGEKMVAKALQTYGAICVDGGGGNDQAMGFYAERPASGTVNPYPAAGFSADWAQLPHIPRNRLFVLAASVTPRP